MHGQRTHRPQPRAHSHTQTLHVTALWAGRWGHLGSALRHGNLSTPKLPQYLNLSRHVYGSACGISRAPHCLPDLKESDHLSLAGYKVHQVEPFGQRRVISWENLLRPLEGWSLRNQLDGSSFIASTTKTRLTSLIFSWTVQNALAANWRSANKS